MINVLRYFGIIGFLVWFIQTQHLFDKIKLPFFKEIRECQICLGTWIGIFLYPNSKIKTTDNVLDIFITASLTSFIIYVFKTGWRNLFGVTIIK